MSQFQGGFEHVQQQPFSVLFPTTNDHLEE
jgi:hypothetical protein